MHHCERWDADTGQDLRLPEEKTGERGWVVAPSPMVVGEAHGTHRVDALNAAERHENGDSPLTRR